MNMEPEHCHQCRSIVPVQAVRLADGVSIECEHCGASLDFLFDEDRYEVADAGDSFCLN
jgi:uncharacterized Fe-S center protein